MFDMYSDIDDERNDVKRCDVCHRHQLDITETWPAPSRSGHQECPCCYSGEDE